MHLELPEDIARDETDAVPFAPSNVRRPLADDKSIVAAVEALRGDAEYKTHMAPEIVRRSIRDALDEAKSWGKVKVDASRAMPSAITVSVPSGR